MAPTTPINIEDFATTQLTLLDAELKAETAEAAALSQSASPKALQRSGLALLNLTVASQRTGLGGKTVVELELDPAVVHDGNDSLPEHGLRTGDIVGLSEQIGAAARKAEKADKKEKGVSGVVVKTYRTGIHVALDKEEAEVPGGKLWMYVISCRGVRGGAEEWLIEYVESNLRMMLLIRGAHFVLLHFTMTMR